MLEKWMSVKANHLFSVPVVVSAVLFVSAISALSIISIIGVLLISILVLVLSILVLVRKGVPVRIPVR